MSRKQRVLTSLRALEPELLQAAKTGSKETLAVVLQSLAGIRDLCRRGLPESSYAVYGEIYDGLLLAIRQMTESEDSDLEQEALSLCQELVRHIIRETEREPNFKKDIFFLPYKASMWDSLESVWKAAYADKEHCNAYVMPIPYCDRNPDGSAAEWHCERALFPKYVPTLDWREIDLKEWHPDVIFYHNPYDDYNRVTSVESRYYSRNLRECADKLVYIPYFVLEEPCTEEGVEHFVTTPGVWNADKVIVQSEAMRELYINILTKKTNQTDRKYWEERISGAGSPKIEKVLTSKKEDFDMPEKWRKLVEGRKVILYNTSLSAMLQHSDKVCDKLRYVFDIFRNRDDVVLWWRPHPLMKSTIHSMRPEIEERYYEIERKYIEEGWGIYDDSPDLHRAIAWSDAYYGDGSSVVWLYQHTGRPVMIQKPWKQDKRGFMIGYVATDEKNVYFIGTSGFWQGIFRMSLENATLHYVDEIPSERKYLFDYQALERIGNKIIIAPYFSEKGFLEYNLCDQKFSFQDIGNDVPRKYNSKVAFSNVVKYHRSLFFLANQSKEIIEYCADTGTYVVHEELKDVLPDTLSTEEVSIGRHCYQMVGSILYFVIAGTNLLIELNLDTFQGKCYEVPYMKKAWNVHIHERKLYIVPLDNDPFVCLDLDSGTIRRLPNCNQDENIMGWYGLASLIDRCVAVPYQRPTMYGMIDEQHGWQIEKELTDEWVGGTNFPGGRTVIFDLLTNPGNDGRCFAYNNCTKCFVEITRSQNYIIRNLTIHPTEWETIRRRIWETTSRHYENDVLGIYDFLESISDDERLMIQEEKLGRYGRKIHDIALKEALV